MLVWETSEIPSEWKELIEHFQPESLLTASEWNKNTFLKVTIKEGRNRQIRRIVSQLGHKVIDLKRVNFASISLGNLREGDWKHIDINKIKNYK